MPIDYYAVCETHKLAGPAVWRQADNLRWFLAEHNQGAGREGCEVRIVSENAPQVELPAEGGYERWVDSGS